METAWPGYKPQYQVSRWSYWYQCAGGIFKQVCRIAGQIIHRIIRDQMANASVVFGLGGDSAIKSGDRISNCCRYNSRRHRIATRCIRSCFPWVNGAAVGTGAYSVRMWMIRGSGCSTNFSNYHWNTFLSWTSDGTTISRLWPDRSADIAHVCWMTAVRHMKT